MTVFLSTVFVVGGILLYYFLTRFFTMFFIYNFPENITEYKTLEHYIHDGGYFPPLGELFFIGAFLDFTFLRPLILFGSLLKKFSAMLEDRRKFRAAKIKYLTQLADYGLSPKDVPKYIRNNDELRDYLKVWNENTARN